MLGSASCSGRACHGGFGTLEHPKDSEYTVWMLHDPHANKAYAVLFTDRSRIMERDLRGLKGVELKAVHPENDSLCLSCHGRSAWLVKRPVGLEEGFGCESCHGPAEKWLGPHTGPAWKKKSAAEKQALGMTSLVTLSDRARVCADCHVGARDREVNHDLIAAGHPRLKFEFATYQADLPRHWQQTRDPGTDFEARSWVVGQVVSAQASLQLLAHRAQTPSKPWPEFTEYDCYACHHEFKQPSWRTQGGYPGRKPGAFPWNSWYYSMPRALAQGASPSGAPDILKGFGTLEQAMQKPLPNRSLVAKQAQAVEKLLGQWLPTLDSGANPRDALQEVLPKLLKDAPDGKQFRTFLNANGGTSWDISAQFACAATAKLASRGQLDNPEVRKTVSDLFSQLQFAPPDGGIFDSPTTFDHEKFIKQLQTIGDLLSK